MRGIVMSVLGILWWSSISAQVKDDWRKFAGGRYSTFEEKEQVFLIETTRRKASTSGYHILRSIDANHQIVKGELPEKLSNVWRVNNEWKLSFDTHSDHSFYRIVVLPAFDVSELAGLEMVKAYPSSNTYLVRGGLSTIKSSLLNNPEVIHITNKIYTPTVESRVIDMNLNPNRVNRIHHSYPSLNGSTETVSIQENNFDITDIDLINRSRVSGLESEQVDNHATEMATIIAGAGNSFITGRGVARKSTIISSDFSDAMPDADQDYLDFGINIQNHSYGIPRANEYGVEARAFDQSAYQNRNLLHVFSSGNEGTEVSSEGTYKDIEGYANLTGNIKMTKNSLVVGSVDTVGNVPSFVSRGPAYDGRVKPEVVAYSVAGSSNSAALVSGVAALLQQQFRQDNATDMPSALAKALLINSAKDVGAEGPDFVTGYGNVDAWRSLEILRNNQFSTGIVSNGEVQVIPLNLPSNAINLKVTLVWTDPPANVNDFTALVNNLDLRLTDGGAVVLPWVLDASPNVADLSKTAVHGVDNLNNVEQVTITDPGISYSIEVEGSTVTGDQEFYVAWQFDIEDSYEWDFPTGSDNMPYNGETGSYFRWTTTKNGVGTLSYTLDGASWIVLDTEVDLADGYWRWNNPPLIGEEVQARMEIAGESFETELFTISAPLDTRVGFNCSDSVLLRWNRSPNAIDYTISNLGEEVLEPFITTTDTFLIIPNKNQFSDTRFSIRPNLVGGKQLLPSPTFDYTLQGIECYVFSFFQTIALDTGIYLNLSLGTTYGIDRIVLERNDLSNYVEISSISQVEGESIVFLDENPNQGFNEHRATIYFVNGEELTLSAGTSFYLTEVPLRIFPNPIRAGDPFSIITKEFEEISPILELIDTKGSLVFRKAIQGTQDIVPTDKLQSGIYFYRLRADGDLHTGRLLIR